MAKFKSIVETTTLELRCCECGNYYPIAYGAVKAKKHLRWILKNCQDSNVGLWILNKKNEAYCPKCQNKK